MKKGQATLDYVFLIGVAAAGLIAMLVYVSRGLQGNVRDRSDQLGSWQYDPGDTTINNSRTKIADSLAEQGSSTDVYYGNLNERNKDLEKKYEDIAEKQKEIEELRKEWELAVVSEGQSEARVVRDGKLDWIQPPAGGELATVTAELTQANNELTQLLADAKIMEDIWRATPKTGNTTGPTRSHSWERGTTSDDKYTNERLGDL